MGHAAQIANAVIARVSIAVVNDLIFRIYAVIHQVNHTVHAVSDVLVPKSSVASVVSPADFFACSLLSELSCTGVIFKIQKKLSSVR